MELQVQPGCGGGGGARAGGGCSAGRHQQGDEAAGVGGQNVSQGLGILVFQEALHIHRDRRTRIHERVFSTQPSQIQGVL